MANDTENKKRDFKQDKSVRQDPARKPAKEGDRPAAGGHLSDEDLDAIAGGPTAVEHPVR